MSLTQEQANAIAEREYPMGSRTMVYADQRHGKVIQTIEHHFEKERQAYAKCLMDHVNPLIEAGEAMRDYMAMHTKAGLQTMTITQEWDAALSNLTRSIEP